ncbi:MAG: hypothetical protein PHV55_07410, partial [Candidatus Omnitrophica bacterium]|nr:hypothetical protein [Candidatus Omnitrophota bacterium]
MRGVARRFYEKGFSNEKGKALTKGRVEQIVNKQIMPVFQAIAVEVIKEAGILAAGDHHLVIFGPKKAATSGRLRSTRNSLGRNAHEFANFDPESMNLTPGFKVFDRRLCLSRYIFGAPNAVAVFRLGSLDNGGDKYCSYSQESYTFSRDEYAWDDLLREGYNIGREPHDVYGVPHALRFTVTKDSMPIIDSEVILHVYPVERVVVIDWFYPEFPKPVSAPEKTGRGRALLYHLLKDYPGYSVIGFTTPSFTKSFNKMKFLLPVAGRQLEIKKAALLAQVRSQREKQPSNSYSYLDMQIENANIFGVVPSFETQRKVNVQSPEPIMQDNNYTLVSNWILEWLASLGISGPLIFVSLLSTTPLLTADSSFLYSKTNGSKSSTLDNGGTAQYSLLNTRYQGMDNGGTSENAQASYPRLEALYNLFARSSCERVSTLHSQPISQPVEKEGVFLRLPRSGYFFEHFRLGKDFDLKRLSNSMISMELFWNGRLLGGVNGVFHEIFFDHGPRYSVSVNTCFSGPHYRGFACGPELYARFFLRLSDICALCRIPLVRFDRYYQATEERPQEQRFKDIFYALGFTQQQECFDYLANSFYGRSGYGGFMVQEPSALREHVREHGRKLFYQDRARRLLGDDSVEAYMQWLSSIGQEDDRIKFLHDGLTLSFFQAEFLERGMPKCDWQTYLADNFVSFLGFPTIRSLDNGGSASFSVTPNIWSRNIATGIGTFTYYGASVSDDFRRIIDDQVEESATIILLPYLWYPARVHTKTEFLKSVYLPKSMYTHGRSVLSVHSEANGNKNYYVLIGEASEPVLDKDQSAAHQRGGTIVGYHQTPFGNARFIMENGLYAYPERWLFTRINPAGGPFGVCMIAFDLNPFDMVFEEEKYRPGTPFIGFNAQQCAMGIVLPERLRRQLLPLPYRYQREGVNNPILSGLVSGLLVHLRQETINVEETLQWHEKCYSSGILNKREFRIIERGLNHLSQQQMQGKKCNTQAPLDNGGKIIQAAFLSMDNGGVNKSTDSGNVPDRSPYRQTVLLNEAFEKRRHEKLLDLHERTVELSLYGLHNPDVARNVGALKVNIRRAELANDEQIIGYIEEGNPLIALSMLCRHIRVAGSKRRRLLDERLARRKAHEKIFEERNGDITIYMGRIRSKGGTTVVEQKPETRGLYRWQRIFDKIFASQAADYGAMNNLIGETKRLVDSLATPAAQDPCARVSGDSAANIAALLERLGNVSNEFKQNAERSFRLAYASAAQKRFDLAISSLSVAESFLALRIKEIESEFTYLSHVRNRLREIGERRFSRLIGRIEYVKNLYIRTPHTFGLLNKCATEVSNIIVIPYLSEPDFMGHRNILQRLHDDLSVLASERKAQRLLFDNTYEKEDAFLERFTLLVALVQEAQTVARFMAGYQNFLNQARFGKVKGFDTEEKSFNRVYRDWVKDNDLARVAPRYWRARLYVTAFISERSPCFDACVTILLAIKIDEFSKMFHTLLDHKHHKLFEVLSSHHGN